MLRMAYLLRHVSHNGTPLALPTYLPGTWPRALGEPARPGRAAPPAGGVLPPLPAGRHAGPLGDGVDAAGCVFDIEWHLRT